MTHLMSWMAEPSRERPALGVCFPSGGPESRRLTVQAVHTVTGTSFQAQEQRVKQLKPSASELR